MVYRRLVLGAGPVGLAAAHVLNVPAVGDRIGGHLEGSPAGPFHLWATSHVERFLRSLQLPVENALVRFGYLTRNGYRDTCSPEERACYYRRSRGLPETAPVPASAMSDGRAGLLPVHPVSREDLLSALRSRVSVLRGKVVQLAPGNDHAGSLWNVLLEGGGKLQARELVSTLPAPVLYKCMQTAAPVLHAVPKVFLIPEPDLRRPLLPTGVDYAYVVDGSAEYDRISAAGYGREVYEFNGQERYERFLDGGGARGGAWERLVNPYGQVVSFAGALPRPDACSAAQWARVYPLGRLARWQHEERVHTVLKTLYEDPWFTLPSAAG